MHTDNILRTRTGRTKVPLKILGLSCKDYEIMCLIIKEIKEKLKTAAEKRKL